MHASTLCPALVVLTVWAWSVMAQWNTTFTYPLDPLRLNVYPYSFEDPTFLPNGSMVISDGELELKFLGKGLSLEGQVTRNNAVRDAVIVESGPQFERVSYFWQTRKNLSEESGVLINWTVPTLELFPFLLNVSKDGVLRVDHLTIDVPVRTQAPSPELWETQSSYLPASLAVENDTAIPLSSRLGSGDIIKSRCRLNEDEPEASNQEAQVDGGNLVLKHLCSLQYFPPANTSLVRVLGPVYSNPKWPKEIEATNEQAGFADPFLNTGCSSTFQPSVTYSEADYDLNFPQFSPGDATNLTMFLIPLDPAKQYQITLETSSGTGRSHWSWCVISGFQTYPFHYDYPASSSDPGAGTPVTTVTAVPSSRPRDVDVIVAAVVGSVGGLLAIVATALLTRRYLLRHRARPEPGFEIDDNVTSDQIEPFSNSDNTAPATTSDLNALEKTDSVAPAPELYSESSTRDDGGSTSKIEAHTVTTNQSQPPDQLKPQPTHPPTTPVAPSGHGSGSVRRRAVHEEDAEDIDVLPPMYREAWAERHQMQLQDGAVAVAGAETGGRANDGAAAFPNEKAR